MLNERRQCKAITIAVALCGAMLLAVVGGVIDSIAPGGMGGFLIRIPAFAVAVAVVLGGFNALCDGYERWLDIPTDRNRVTAFHDVVASEFERRELTDYRYKIAAIWPTTDGSVADQHSSTSASPARSQSAAPKATPVKQWVGQ